MTNTNVGVHQRDAMTVSVGEPSYATFPYHLLWYVCIWALFFALEALLPVVSNANTALVALVATLVYVIISTSLGFVGQIGCAKSLSSPPKRRALLVTQVHTVLVWSVLLSFVGFAFLWYDRVVVQGIDYSRGAAVARQLWRIAGEERAGISSFASVIGYFFGSFYFVTVAMVHLHWENIKGRYRLFSVISVLVLIGANSYLLGGRSIVMMQLAAIVSVGVIRQLSGRSFMPGVRLIRLLWLTLVFIAGFMYSVYVFVERSEAASGNAQLYVGGVINLLGGVEEPGYYQIDRVGEPWSSFLYYSVAAGGYLVHSFWSFQIVLQSSTQPGDVSFAYYRGLLSKLGLVSEAPQAWLLGAGFISVPGSMWYDFGWVGFVVGAIVHGVLLILVPTIVARGRGGGFALAIAVSILMVSLMSPLGLATDVFSFPFMLIGYFGMVLITRPFFGGRCWLSSESS